MVFRKKNGKSLLVKEQWYTYTTKWPQPKSSMTVSRGWYGNFARSPTRSKRSSRRPSSKHDNFNHSPLLRRLLGKGCGIGVHLWRMSGAGSANWGGPQKQP